ncbi:MAG: class I SAM-dependent methyltransferase [Gemmataceae bacterium]
MTATRLLTEREFHDRQAAGRSADLTTDAHLRFADADYLDHETWVRPAFAKLGDVRGKAVLDYGCGHGMAAVVLARAGAVVTGFDLSPGYVAEAGQRAVSNGVAATFVAADAEHLPFADGSFDAVWGNAVLHHLDLDRAGAELRRVLRPGGVAVFCEPWGGNPVLEFARRRLPYPGKDRTPDEHPLRPRDLAPLRRHFPRLTVEGHQLFGMLRRVWPGRAVRLLDALDARLLRLAPSAANWCRYVVLTLPRG